MAIKEFHEWIKTKKNFKENNGGNPQPQFDSSILAARFPKFKIWIYILDLHLIGRKF